MEIWILAVAIVVPLVVIGVLLFAYTSYLRKKKEKESSKKAKRLEHHVMAQEAAKNAKVHKKVQQFEEKETKKYMKAKKKLEAQLHAEAEAARAQDTWTQVHIYQGGAGGGPGPAPPGPAPQFGPGAAAYSTYDPYQTTTDHRQTQQYGRPSVAASIAPGAAGMPMWGDRPMPQQSVFMGGQQGAVGASMYQDYGPPPPDYEGPGGGQWPSNGPPPPAGGGGERRETEFF
uniref:Uncharacterized protein n=1 Tax=Chromera velia CCMP2878 TaxID=1169474 RepID=A0A0G4F5D1_9ALVE|eukprot:Cvel_15292.t1-p1 / transcript=Cvel_15292.t1 / gene=Cvel_15292 / organism=Chromera_velia_CCMP2878 / gene_product=hypothetical protein / transcript_product=hypothetical protein / location=Cvel_scaffold1122:22020-23641(-) / protein_length=229 / sequence_SO=supercontig / SO=protein_coding / is_pseudo=false